MNVNVISAITRKDLIDAIRHRYMLTALVTPLLVALLFRVMLPSLSGGKLLTVVVHDAGGSGLVTELRNTPQIGVVEVSSADATAREVETRKAIGGLVVPANFDSDIAAGKQPELIVYVNNRKTPFEQAALRQMLDRMVRAFAKQPEPARLTWVDLDKDPKEQFSVRAGLDQILLPLLLILTFGMTGAFIVPLLIVEEKEKRTLDFLLSSPASLKDIVAGKALTGVAYTLLIAGLLLGLNRRRCAVGR
jgi:ABC-2 type transport system permease protein